MEWPVCPVCDNDKVNVTTDNYRDTCSCCGNEVYKGVGWRCWCYHCEFRSEIMPTALEAIDDFKKKATDYFDEC
jgi:hypothetical protein